VCAQEETRAGGQSTLTLGRPQHAVSMREYSSTREPTWKTLAVLAWQTAQRTGGGGEGTRGMAEEKKKWNVWLATGAWEPGDDGGEQGARLAGQGCLDLLLQHRVPRPACARVHCAFAHLHMH
jgi:hypothetical protein